MSKNAFRPDFLDLVFSLKTFAAAILALFIAFCFDLQTPAWALTTVYIVANPLSGASTSKAVYRLIGTTVGGTASVVIVPNLVNSPELLTLAIAVWVGFCLALSLLDRSPRSYSYMLAGYTAAMTSLPLVDSPGEVFTYTTSRVVEISIAIICAAVINRVIFPRHAGPVLLVRVDRWLDDVSLLIADAFSGRAQQVGSVGLWRKLGIDAADIRLFTTHVAYDTSEHRAAVGWSRSLQARMVTMLPIISGIADVKAAMARRGVEPSETMLAMTAQLSASIRSKELVNLHETMTACRQTDDDCMQGWENLLLQNLTVRLDELAEVWDDCIRLRNQIALGNTTGALPRRTKQHRDLVHVDLGMAVFSGISAALAIIVGSFAWIATGWSSGAGMPLIAGILMSFFATQDNPTPVVRKFLKFSLCAMALSFVFVFAIMPMIATFEELAFGLAFLFVPLGLLIAKPATFLPGMVISTSIPSMLTLQARPVLDLATFLNTNLATILGTILAIYIASLVRAVETEWSATRVLRLAWADISHIARRPRPNAFEPLMHRMLDRFAVLAPRMAALPPESRVHGADILKDTRVGINAITLQRCKTDLVVPVRGAVDDVLGRLAEYYQTKRRVSDTHPSLPLLHAIDDCLRALRKAVSSVEVDRIRVAVVSLRYSLFPYADGWHYGEPIYLHQAAE
ncbi:FUSC family protein [Neorhizobium sp. NCHU2750]|uniref:FUSC family protein n=1 Tax=Neorhizobium sp. NCHU2750 TaxID=1825976 RepID=UPI000E769C83|nr:hypothetical protein NCHU2750_42250 [Neorhizobium sp. NCHU2750]